MELLLQIVLMLAAAAVVELPVAAFYTRPKIVAEVKALLHDPKVRGAMRGGGDPTDLATRRWEAAEERSEREAQLELWLVDNVGIGSASAVKTLLPSVWKIAVKLDPALWDAKLKPLLQKHAAKLGGSHSLQTWER